MQVVHVYDGHEKVYDGRGSVPGVVWNIARETAAAGHEVTVIERQWDGLDPQSVHEGVRFERLALRTGADDPWTRVPYELVDSPVKLLRLVGDRTNFAIAALRRLRELDADVIHVHLPFAANVLVTVAPWIRNRMVYTAHLGELRLDALTDGPATDGGSEGIDVPSILSHISPDVYLARRAAATTVLNSTIEQKFAERNVPAAKLTTISNGVDIDRFTNVDKAEVDQVRSRYELDDDPVTLFVGTIMPRKRLIDLVCAWDEAGANGTLVLAGDSDLDEEYTERARGEIRERGLRDRVQLTGFVPAADLPSLYSIADLFVLPSLEEGFGMTVIEAMAASTPVVATRVGATPRIIDDGEHGLLVESGDVEALAGAIDTLLDDSTQRQRMSRRALTRARAYSWCSVAKEFISAYQKVKP